MTKLFIAFADANFMPKNKTRNKSIDVDTRPQLEKKKKKMESSFQF